MSNASLVSLALLGGILLAIQGGFNSQLSTQLKSPFLAALISFVISSILAGLVIALSLKKLPDWQEVQLIPPYLWFAGAMLGISSMISLGLTGQMLISVIAGHFGWFGLEVEPISLRRLLGIAAMIIGIILINHHK